MQLGLRVSRDQLPTVGVAVPDLGAVRRERGHLGVEALCRGVLLETPVAGVVEAACGHRDAPGLLV